jgi:CheY-like chemotaxis protein
VAVVLVVEEETEAREAIAQVLGAAGHVVAQATDGREGLDSFLRHRPRLILCDILVPERDGLAMIAALRSGGIEVPVVAMLEPESAQSLIAALRGDGIEVPVVAGLEPDAAQASLLLDLALALGANGVLLKPVLVSELLKTAAELLAPARLN